MTVKVFVDTNILVYAYDRGAGERHEKALSLIEQLWRDGNGILSTQVLQEFYVNVRRKAQNPVTVEQARALISDYLTWHGTLSSAMGQPFWKPLTLKGAINCRFGMR
jgi:predicted nucleic acid-binding protein